MIKTKTCLLLTLILAVTLLSGCEKHSDWTEIPKDGYLLLEYLEGPTLGYASESGLELLEEEGFVFKDLNGNGTLDPYEDVPHDMRPHVDRNGNTYEFGFGLAWSGVIRDERTAGHGIE